MATKLIVFCLSFMLPALATAIAQGNEQQTEDQNKAGSAMSVDLSEQFNGEFSIDWDVLRPDEDYVSLETNPGSLTITTQRGSINGDSEADAVTQGVLPKNFHLVENPLDWMRLITSPVDASLRDFSGVERAIQRHDYARRKGTSF